MSETDMKTLKLEDILSGTADVDEDSDDYDYYEEGWYRFMESNTVEDPTLGTIYVKERVGGSEGAGEHVHLVLHIPSLGDDFYVKREAFYASHDGITWDDYGRGLYRVRPREVTVTHYEKI